MTSAFIDWLSMNELALLQFMAWIMIITGALVSLVLLCTPLKAAYGRYAYQTPAFVTCKVDARWAWCLQEMPSFWIPFFLLLLTGGSSAWTIRKVTVVLYMLHYFQRSFVYSYLIRGGKATPLHTALLAFTFASYNGYLQGRYHLLTQNDVSFNFVNLVGFCCFVIGVYINIESDSILRNLRKPGETGYKIPQGGLFDYVSGANFFGEILEWTGYALFSWSFPAFAFALFTIFNIGPRAWHHHRYYQQKFKDYPKERKAIIPFIL